MFSFFNAKANSNATDVTNEGPNISSTALGKVYGWFVEQLHTLYPLLSTQELISKYPHPVMCVIGCESTGKSATIESISKVPIFPSDTGICTRCPIKVVLMPTDPNTSSHYELSFRGKNKVYKDENLIDLKATIADIFRDVLKSSPTGIGYSDEVITIVVHRPDVIRMDFVDLPGIVSYPPDAKEFTLSLSQKYIDDPNCFILCVANATTPRLTSYEPIACIAAANACERSIIVLPMTDKLSPRDFETHLLNRVTMSSDELRGQPFTACCAVVNRSNVSDCTLTQQAQREQDWFQSNILQPMEQGIQQYKATTSTTGTTTGTTSNTTTTSTSSSNSSINSGSNTTTIEQYKAMVVTLHHTKQRLGINMLLQVTNEKYEEYIKTRWMPRTLEEINKDILLLTEQCDDLGIIPNALNISAFQEYYNKYIHNKIWNIIIEVIFDQLNNITETELLVLPTSTEKWNNIQNNLDNIEHTILLNMAKEHTNTAKSNYNKPPYKWARFEATYIPYITTIILNMLNTNLQPHFHLLYSTIHSERIKYEESETFIQLIENFNNIIKNTCTTAITVENALIENTTTASIRAELLNKIEIHRNVQFALQEKVLSMNNNSNNSKISSERVNVHQLD